MATRWFAILACALSPAWSLADAPAQDPPERMLANIEAQRRVADDDPRIAKIRTALAKADKLYKEDLLRIMDLTLYCWKEIRADGQSVSMVEVLTGSLECESPANLKRNLEREYGAYVAMY